MSIYRLTGICWTLFLFACTRLEDPVPFEQRFLAGDWSFEEGGGEFLEDGSGEVGTGRVYDADNAWSDAGVDGYAFNGTGESFIEIEDADLPDNFPGKLNGKPGSFSLLAWINLKATAYPMIVAKDNIDGRSFNFAVNREGVLSVQIYNTEGDIQLTGKQVLSPDHGWVHVAAVYKYNPGELSSVTLYIDGEVDRSQSYEASPIKGTSTALRIGSRDYNAFVQNRFRGLIDNLKIYTWALDREKILDNQ